MRQCRQASDFAHWSGEAVAANEAVIEAALAYQDAVETCLALVPLAA
jgi:hypothetical protein